MVELVSARAIKLRNNILNKHVEEIRESALFNIQFDRAFNNCLKTIAGNNIQQIICYGLGNIHSGTDLPSCYQLALLILIHNKLSSLNLLENTTIEVYDPKFDEHDKETLEAFDVPKFKVLTENEHCCRRMNDCPNYRLFYMPHLDYHLYNNLLGVNWDPEDLGKLIILGNSFTEMVDYAHDYKRSKDLCYLSPLVCGSRPRLPEKRSRKRRNKVIKEELTEIKEDGALLEYQVASDYNTLECAFSQLSFHIVSRPWLADTKNHAFLSESKPHGWSPTIIVETLDSFDDS